MKMNICHCQAE